MSKLIAALMQLEPGNDGHWTQDGLPRLETVKLFAADPSITRESITSIAPGFSRGNPVIGGAPTQAAPQAFAQAGAPMHSNSPAIAAPAAPQPGATMENSDGVLGAGAGPDDSDSETEPEVAQNPLQAAIEQARGLLDIATAAKTKADQQHKEATLALDAALDAATKAGVVQTFQAVYAGYAASQRKLLEMKAEQIKRIKAANIDFKALIPQRAPLDESMRRKTARGGKRPAYPTRVE